MNNKVEAELLKSMNNLNSLEDVFLMSNGSVEITNLVLMKIINQQHHIHFNRNQSTYCQIFDSSAAAA